MGSEKEEKMERQKKRERYDRRMKRLGEWLDFFIKTTVCVLGPAFLFYLLHLYIKTYAPPSNEDNLVIHALKDLPKELSLAILIAYVLGFSAEYWSRRRHEQQQDLIENDRAKMQGSLTEDVYSAVFGRNFPDGVSDVVKNHILNSKISRREFSVELTIERTSIESTDCHVGPDARERAKIRTRQLFQTHNLDKNEPTQWTMTCTIDDRRYAQHKEQDEHCHFERLVLQLCAADGEVDEVLVFKRQPASDERDIKGIVKPQDHLSGTRRTQSLEFPLTISKGGWVAVECVYVQAHPLDGADCVVTRNASDGMKIDIGTPNRDFEVEAVSMHADDEKRTSGLDDDLRWKYEISHALLPGNGFYYTWAPRGPGRTRGDGVQVLTPSADK